MIFTKGDSDRHQGVGHQPRGALCILNPAAGRLRKRSLRTALIRNLRRLGIDIVETQGVGSAEQLAVESGDYSLLIACGGDGTVLEVVNGMDLNSQRLAVLPGGRGNSVARDLGAVDMGRALDAVGRGKMRRIDLISCEIELAGRAGSYDRRAVNAVGFGILVKVVSRARRAPRLGSLGYALCGLFSVPDPRRYEVTSDEGPFQLPPLAGVVLGNTKHFARFVPSPAASAADAKLELLLLPAGLVRAKMLEVGVIAGIGAFGATVGRVEQVDIRPESAAPLYVDGEVLEGVVRLRACCVPGSLSCIVAEPEA
jgi:diacylglycerol kinase family enzyme